MGEANRRAEAFEGRPKCATCIHWHRDQRQMGHCRRGPPTMYPIPMQNPLKPGEVQMVPQSSFPPISEDRYCGEHPDFLRWYSQNRERAGAIDALEREAVAAS